MYTIKMQRCSKMHCLFWSVGTTDIGDTIQGPKDPGFPTLLLIFLHK